jgi:rubrerythrin
MTFKVISEEGGPDYEIWMCDICGHSVVLAGVGGDVAECPVCIAREYEDEARHSE